MLHSNSNLAPAASGWGSYHGIHRPFFRSQNGSGKYLGIIELVSEDVHQTKARHTYSTVAHYPLEHPSEYRIHRYRVHICSLGTYS